MEAMVVLRCEAGNSECIIRVSKEGLQRLVLLLVGNVRIVRHLRILRDLRFGVRRRVGGLLLRSRRSGVVSGDIGEPLRRIVINRAQQVRNRELLSFHPVRVSLSKAAWKL